MTTVVVLNNNIEYICTKDYESMDKLPNFVLVWKTPRKVMIITKDRIKDIKTTKSLMDFM